MLKQRIITALTLIPLVFAALWYLPTAWVAGLMGLLMLVCVWEWNHFLSFKAANARTVYLVLGAACLVVLHPLVFGDVSARLVLTLGLLWWGGALVWLQLYPRGFDSNSWTPWLRSAIGFAAVLPCYLALWKLHELPMGRELIILLLFLVWATDTGGYFAGKKLGRNKLAPQISPNKTWEGLIGGVLLALLVAYVGGSLILGLQLRLTLVLGAAVSLVSIIGDLTVSMFKRQCGIKDTGNLFPGHGGALDRLDSMLSAAPLMLVICLQWNLT